jgi:hypothetical protein
VSVKPTWKGGLFYLMLTHAGDKIASGTGSLTRKTAILQRWLTPVVGENDFVQALARADPG